jgi:hypothetical protein
VLRLAVLGVVYGVSVGDLGWSAHSSPPNLDDPGWLTLEEAGARARVTEVSEAGSVPFLQVANGADRPLLLLDGEELIAAKQNRILNTTVLVQHSDRCCLDGSERAGQAVSGRERLDAGPRRRQG